jgi:hypothetical protein
MKFLTATRELQIALRTEKLATKLISRQGLWILRYLGHDQSLTACLRAIVLIMQSRQIKVL